MASTRLRETKSGQRYYEITVSRGRGKSYLTTRWEVPAGWSKRAIERELAKQAADFERKVKAGEVVSRKEKKEAEAKAAEEAAKILTLKQFSEKVFMPALTVTASENTRASFQSNLNLHIYPVLGNLKMPEITPPQISALLLDFQKSGKSHASCIKLYTVLNMLFKKAYMDDEIERNPMDKVQRPKPTKEEGKDTEIEAYTAPELAYIMQCLDREPLKWRAFVRLLIDSGIRRGECCGLRWSAVDFTNNTVTIEKCLNYTPQKGIYLDTPKSGKSRTIYIDPAVMDMLKELKAQQRGKKTVIDLKASRDGYVFTQEDGQPIHPQSPTRYFKKFGERYGVQDFHPHKLRHSFASVAIINGADVASVSEKLGHADKAVTLRMYTHADAESQKRASEIFRNAVNTKEA